MGFARLVATLLVTGVPQLVHVELFIVHVALPFVAVAVLVRLVLLLLVVSRGALGLKTIVYRCPLSLFAGLLRSVATHVVTQLVGRAFVGEPGPVLSHGQPPGQLERLPLGSSRVV